MQGAEFAAFLVPCLIAGYDVPRRAWHGTVHRQPFDENLLMGIATIGVVARIDEHRVLIGNDALMRGEGVAKLLHPLGIGAGKGDNERSTLT